jgi:CHAT domain-containing protein
VLKCILLTSGRLHHITGELDSAISFLQQGLTAAESSNVTPSVRKKLEEDEARIRHRLGLVLWQTGQDLDEARQHLDQSATILETIRRQPKHSTEKLDLYDLQTECYELLQRILVTLERENEALIIAERARTRAFIDLLYDRKANSGKVNQSNNNTANSTKKHSIEPCSPSSVAEVVNLVNRQKASVLYYSIAAGFLYSWLIVPTKGIVKFHQVSLQDDGDDKSEDDDELANRSIELKDSSKSMLENHVHNIRASLGVDSTTTNDDTDMDGDMWSSHLDALGDRLNQEGDRSGFLRMVNRSSKLNASSYSLSSLFSVGSVNCGSTISGAVSRQSARGSTAGGKRNPGGPVGRALWQGPSSLRALYKLLLEPMEEDLPEGFPCELVLVLEGDLYLVPFSMLRGSVGSGSSAESTTEYLCERYSLLIAPSLTAIKTAKSINKNVKTDQPSSALIVGNPKMPSSVSEHWGWNDIPYSAQEADTVAEIMQSSSMTGDKATKEAIISQLSQAECIHLACHVSWKLSAIVLSPGEYVESKSSGNSPPSAQNNISMNKKYTSIQTDTIHEENDSESSQNNSNHHNIGGEMASTIAGEMPALSEFLLTAGDILNLKLSNAKLVVISSCYTRDEQHGNVTSDGLIALTRALLAAGAQCVLVSLWPVPDTAVKLIMKALYSSLLQGARVSRALADAMTTVQNTKHFQHPANWAGFILVGSDVKLSNKVALMGQALRDILGTPESCRDAFRVTLHLVSIYKFAISLNNIMILSPFHRYVIFIVFMFILG